MGAFIYDQVEIIETTQCRFCDQSIDLQADRCPYCLVTQSIPSSVSRVSVVACALLLVFFEGSVHFDRISMPEVPNPTVAKTDVEPIAVPMEITEMVPEKPAAIDQDRLAEELPAVSLRSTDPLPSVCADIAGDTSICESLVRVLEQQLW